MFSASTDEMDNLVDIISAMNQARFRNRPSCSHVLSQKSQWFGKHGQSLDESSKIALINNDNYFTKLIVNLNAKLALA